MVTKYKAAVIGGAGGRARNWIDDIYKHQETELVAICDIREKEARKVTQDHGNCNVYSDVNDLLKKESLDFCVVATPHYLHAPQTVLCAENDVSVLCEKPMAINLQQADRMIIAARKNCITLGIGFQFRFKPVFKYLYDAARGAKGELGDLGRITDFSMVARHYRSDMYYLSSTQVDPMTGVSAGQWRGRWETEGAGILINQSVHDIDIFQWIVGPIKTLSAHAATIAKEHALIEVEDTVTACFTTQTGALGTMVFSTSNKKSLPNHYVVQGENGYVSSTASYGNVITGDTRYKDEEDWEVPFMVPPRNNLLENFIDAMSNDVDPVVPGEEGRKSVEIIRAILKSVQEERAVHFPVKDTMTYPTLNNLSRESPDEMRKSIYGE
ncbi:MAG: Gfo/Idh/MocA family protein [Candidatus Hodarchaeota archaeon]